MDQRVKRITEVVKQHDRALFAYRSGSKILIMRQGDRLEASDYNQSEPELSKLNPQFVFALTDSWKIEGSPVEWGLEPIMDQLKARDGWNRTGMFEEMVKKREREQDAKDRAQRNQFRDLAGELRGDFARATNDINTSTLEKVDRRRVTDGYC